MTLVLRNGTPPESELHKYKLVATIRGYPIYERIDMAKVTATQVLKDAAELKEAKSKDYQGGLFTEQDYFPYGHQSFCHMLWTKMLRIRSVADQETTNFESLEDSLLDMINYAAMYAAWIENQKND